MSKPRNKNVPKTIDIRDAKFVYTSLCCQSVAAKPTCSVPQNARISTHLGAVPPDDRLVGLGSWRCRTCNKPCKVQRTAQKEVAKAVAA